MKISFTGKNMVVTEAMKTRFSQKIEQRLSRLLPENADVFVTIGQVKQNTVIEVTIPLNKRQIRAEVSVAEWLNGVDDAAAALERQIVKYKTRLKSKSRRDHSFKEELNYFAATNVEKEQHAEEDTDAGVVIEKTKKFALKPMDAEEAVMEMEMLAHSFFVFRNAVTDEINVVYKRKDGKYGLIEPNAQ